MANNNIDPTQGWPAFQQNWTDAGATLYPVFQLVAAQASANEQINARFDELAGSVQELRDGLAGGIQEFRDELAGGIQGLRDGLAGGIHELRDELAGGIQELRDERAGGIQELRRELAIDRRGAHARTTNLSNSGANRNLVVLPREDGELPLGFPETYDAFKGLNGEQIDALLFAYELPCDGPVEGRRLRLASFIGLRYD